MKSKRCFLRIGLALLVPIGVVDQRAFASDPRAAKAVVRVLIGEGAVEAAGAGGQQALSLLEQALAATGQSARMTAPAARSALTGLNVNLSVATLTAMEQALNEAASSLDIVTTLN